MKNSVKVLPLGILMGVFVCSMVFVSSWEYAALLLLFIGIFSGMLIVPLNALLQHRGHILIGSGHSIAAQNFSENLGYLNSKWSLYAYGQIRPTYNWNCIYIWIICPYGYGDCKHLLLTR